MQILSAIDAISPAISRTKLVLFSPFRLGRTWKLGATGYLAFAATFFLPFPLLYLSFVPHLLHSGKTGAAIAVLCCIALLTLIFFGLFYVFARLEFVFFDIVLNRGEFVAPAWRKYGPQTWPWIGLKVAVGLVVTVIMVAPLTAYARNMISLSSNMQPAPMDPAQSMAFITHIFAAEMGIMAFFGMLLLIGSLLTDFVLPSLALESTPLREAFRRFGRLIGREPGQITGFVLLKIALGVGGYIAQTILLYICILILVVVLCILFFIGYLILHALHVSAVVMIVLACVIGIPAYLFTTIYGVFLFIGTLLTFLQAYSLYFLGGRYPAIGLALEQSTPQPVLYAYPPPPPAFAYAPPQPPPSIYSPEAYTTAESAPAEPTPPTDPTDTQT